MIHGSKEILVAEPHPRTVIDSPDAVLGVAERLAGLTVPERILEETLRCMFEVVGCNVGFASIVDETRGRYDKTVALNIGAAPLHGIPLREGLTGAIVRSRGAVMLEDFEASRLPKQHGTIDSLHATVGVPMIWQDRIIGALFVFSVDAGRCFDEADIEMLRLIAAQAATALQHARVNGRTMELAVRAASELARDETIGQVRSIVEARLGVLLDDQRERAAVTAAVVRAVESIRCAGADEVALGLPLRVSRECAWIEEQTDVTLDLVVSGDAGQMDPAQEDAVVQAVRLTLAVFARRDHVRRIRVGMVYGQGLTILIEDDAGRGRSDGDLELVAHLVERSGGRWDVESIPGWGSRVRIHVGGSVPVASVLTGREEEVAIRVAAGLQDKQIAAALGISVKTVEKHMGSIFRKTGMHNRVMLAAWMGRQVS